jgi:hypothetical protein
MAISFSSVPYRLPGADTALSANPSSETFGDIAETLDSLYKFSPRQIFFSEIRDEDLFVTFATDSKSGFYPWYNDSGFTDAENSRVWDFRIFNMPVYVFAPLPMSRNSISTNAGTGAVSLRRGAISTTFRGRNVTIRTVLKWIRMNTVIDPLDGLPYYTGTYTVQGSNFNGANLSAGAWFETDYDTLIPVGFDPRVPGDLLMVDVAYYQFTSSVLEPGMLSALQVWAKGPGDFPAGSY